MNITNEHLIPTKSHGEKDGEKAKTEQLNSSPSSKITTIEGSPFAIYEIEIGKDKRYVVIMGKNVITAQGFETIEEARYWIEKTDWNSMLNIMYVFMQQFHEEKRLERKAKLNEITNNKNNE